MFDKRKLASFLYDKNVLKMEIVKEKDQVHIITKKQIVELLSSC